MDFPCRTATLGLAVGFLLFPRSAAGQERGDEAELLQFVQSAHKASRDLILTSHCRVKFEITVNVGNPPAPLSQSCSSEHWHSDNAVRVRVIERDHVVDYVWKDSIENAIVTKEVNGKKQIAATRNGFPTRYTHRGDAWVRGLLVVNLPGSSQAFPFEDLLGRASKVLKVSKKALEGGEMIVVRLLFTSSTEENHPWESEIYFDPSVNYLIRRVIRSRTGSRFADIEEVVSYKDCGKGVFFPERVVGRAGVSDEPSEANSQSLLSDIHINEPLAPGIFRLRFPHGISLTDSVRGTTYRVDSEGNPLSAEKPLGTAPPPAPSRLAGPDKGAETVAEPRPRSRWILPVSVGLLVLGGFLAIRRRWKAKAP